MRDFQVEEYAEIKDALREMGAVLSATYVREFNWLGGLRAKWPDAPFEQLGLKDRLEQDEQGGAPVTRIIRIEPGPEAIDRGLELLWLVMALEPQQRIIVVGWATREPMRELAKALGISKRTGWYLLRKSCAVIEKKLHTRVKIM